MADQQLTVFEAEFSIDNWRLEGQGIVEDFSEANRTSGEGAKSKSATSWRMADWLLYGQQNLKDDANFEVEAAKVHEQLSRRTIWDYIRTAKAFPESRRRDSLSWSHHKEIATAQFSAEQQDGLLARAEKQKLSVIGLRDAVQKQLKLLPKPTRDRMKNKKINLAFGPSNFDLISRLASARKVDRQQLLVDIIFGFFRSNKDILLKEIEEYEARFKEAQSREAKQ